MRNTFYLSSIFAFLVQSSCAVLWSAKSRSIGRASEDFSAQKCLSLRILWEKQLEVASGPLYR